MQPDRTRQQVADEVRVLMARHRTSQEALGAVLGLHQTAVGRRVRGEVAFDVEELSKIAEHFGVQLAELLPAGARGAA